MEKRSLGDTISNIKQQAAGASSAIGSKLLSPLTTPYQRDVYTEQLASPYPVVSYDDNNLN